MTPGQTEDERRSEDRRPTVLVVDDSNAIRRILSRTLEGAGYRVTEADDGAKAIAACRADRPDLVLLDIDMPVMDGTTALSVIRGDEELRTLPVIFLTARTGGEDVATGLGLGAQDYLRKPCEPAELTARVAMALRVKAQEDFLARQAAEMDALSATDTLTGLGNRRRLDARIEELVAELGPDAIFTAVLVDIDHFKNVNDTHGHGIGDLVLRIVAGRMSGAVKDDGHTIVRWGGEEFVVVAVGLDDAARLALAERVRAAVGASAFSISVDETIPVTVSAGCASGPLQSFETVLQSADEALYEAKRTGRDRVVVAG